MSETPGILFQSPRAIPYLGSGLIATTFNHFLGTNIFVHNIDIFIQVWNSFYHRDDLVRDRIPGPLKLKKLEIISFRTIVSQDVNHPLSIVILCVYGS